MRSRINCASQSNPTVIDTHFRTKLASFLAQMCYNTIEDAAPTTRKAGVELREEREATNPRYILELFGGILRGIGSVADSGAQGPGGTQHEEVQ